MLKFKAASVMVAIFLAVLLTCPVLKAQTQNNQIAVFYLNKVLDTSKKGKDASKKLETRYDTFKKSVEAKERDFQKKAQDLQAAKATLSADAYQKRERDFATEYNNHVQATQKEGMALEKAKDDAMLPIMEKISTVAATLAQERGYQYVIEVNNGGVFYHPKAVDLTDDIIKGVDK
ncbi:MAG: OmpH family outer membrane protein [Deltaproteobacteria bacterium]|jgi:Skp family chaperone for outer membrane proteins|nr:OmpH family outer membrane protein [Deltaproteobacteria bacterium]